MQKRLQKFKNQMKNVIQTYKKKFEKTIVEVKNCIDKLLKTIQNKKKIIDFLKAKLADKLQVSVKSKNDKRSIEFETESDDVQNVTKKMLK